MTKQPEALFLAECIDRDNYGAASTQIEFRASKELRRLHEVNAELLEALKWMVENDETNEGDDPVVWLGGASWNEYNDYWISGLNKAKAAIAKATGETE
jgi:hypothetical protein